MNTSTAVQWGYKKSEQINQLGDQVQGDINDLRSQIEALRVASPLGYSDYFWVRSVNAGVIELSGHGWQKYNVVGGHVLRTSGATTYGDAGTVTAQTYSNITVTGITLEPGDRIRIETDLPSTGFFQVDLSTIDYGDTYL